MGHKKTIFFYLLCAVNATIAMQRTARVFDAEELVKQDIGEKTKELARLLYGWYVPGISEIKLECALWNAFDVLLFHEHSARIKFFDFLREVKSPDKSAKLFIAQEMPVVHFEGDALPPIMCAWVLGKLSAEQVIGTVNGHIDCLGGPSDVKDFYRALVRVTFDSKIMSKTCRLHKKKIEAVDRYRAAGAPTYLVGHCAPELRTVLNQKAPGLLEKFDKVLFSSDCVGVNSETQFNADFWYSQLEKTGVCSLH